jgi:lysophospholipase L1-like esterase
MIAKMAWRFFFFAAMLSTVISVLMCSNPVEKADRKPKLTIVSDTTVSVKDPVVLSVSTEVSSAAAVFYQWRIDNRAVLADSDGICILYFGIADTGAHTVIVAGTGKSGLVSDPETTFVSVLLNPPRLRMLTRDTVVFANESVFVRAMGTDTNGWIIRYLWSMDSAGYSRATDSAWCAAGWGAVAGTHRVRVRAMDDDSILSAPESVLVTVRLDIPELSAMADTGVAINDTLVLYAARIDTFAAAVRYAWAEKGGLFFDTTSVNTLAVVFGRHQAGLRTIMVKAINVHGLESVAESLTISVRLDPPVVTIVSDTSVAINDTIVLSATAKDQNGGIMAYVWARKANAFLDTTKTGDLPLRFTRKDTGDHIIKVMAIDDDSLLSNVDSVNLTVRMKPPPEVRCMDDTSVFINDSVLAHAVGTMNNSNSPITAYVWTRDRPEYTDTTAEGVLGLRFSRADIGRHTIKVKALDRDTMESLPDSMVFTVLLGAPQIRPLRDTIIPPADTVTAVIVASDANGAIKKYYWALGQSGWTDSADIPSRSFTLGLNTALPVIAGARDDDGNMALDTFVIYSATSCSITVKQPLPHDTVCLHASDQPPGKVVFAFSAHRRNGVSESFTYTVLCGKNPTDLISRYSGKDTVCTLSAIDTGRNYWKVVAVDSHNDSSAVTDSVWTILQRQVCFVGHSIVTGLGGAPDSGGFRRIVIDTLRSIFPEKKKLKFVGPLSTNTPALAGDDSCLAVIGRRCPDIFDSLLNHPNLTADAWVYMMGVNDGYSYAGWYYALSTIDAMHDRNPKSEIYVLSVLPLPHDTSDAGYNIDAYFRTNLAWFNRKLDSTVTIRRQQWRNRKEGGIWMVDVFNPMAILPDSVYNPVYFDDFIHPNQKGYTLMGNRIIGTIKANTEIFK